MRKRSLPALLLAAPLAAALISTGGIAPPVARAADAPAPVNVGLVYSKTGFLGGYGAEYADGGDLKRRNDWSSGEGGGYLHEAGG